MIGPKERGMAVLGQDQIVDLILRVVSVLGGAGTLTSPSTFWPDRPVRCRIAGIPVMPPITRASNISGGIL